MLLRSARWQLHTGHSTTFAAANIPSLQSPALHRHKLAVASSSAHVTTLCRYCIVLRSAVAHQCVPVQQFQGGKEDMALSSSYLQRAYNLTGLPSLLIADAVGMPVVMTTMVEAMQDRVRIEAALDGLLRRRLV